jgi:tetratricopeptide (TPR) repeat protein
MSKSLFNLVTVVCLFWSAQALADGTNIMVSQVNTDEENAFLQIQAQLHETQLAFESNRQQTIAALEHNADALGTNIQLLQQNMANETESAQRVEQAMFIVGVIGMLALAAVVTMVFLQLRAATRLIELAMSSPASALNNARALPVVETANILPPSARAALEFSNARLLGVIERLEKRILELEHTARTPLAENHSHSSMDGETPTERRVTDLIAEGQLFLDTNKPDKALSCFDAALKVQPNLADALIKKAAALEKLERTDDAIACYDQAIEAEESATTALLQKGGLLNRLARYEEALQCYERALQTQERKAATA